MKYKWSLIPLVLALLLSACGQARPEEGAVPAAAEDTSEPVITEPPATEPPAPDFALAHARYAPEETVLTVDGFDVNWEKYFGALAQRAEFFWVYYGVSDYSLPLEDDGETVGDWVREETEIDLASIAMFKTWAEELGIALTEEDYAQIDAEIREYADLYYEGDTEAMFADLGASEEFTRFQGEYARYNDAVFAYYFGAEGEKLPDADAVASMTDHGYLYAKRILFRTADAEGTRLDEETRAAAQERAEAVLAELRACPAEALPERFDALMREYSEDASLSLYPDGYYFTEGEIDAMYDGVSALAEGELSGVVECSYGYQILYRPPMDPEHVFETAEDGTAVSVRRWAAGILFNAMAEERYENLTVEYAPGFERLDLQELFTGVTSD